jgi:hypothetical protein
MSDDLYHRGVCDWCRHTKVRYILGDGSEVCWDCLGACYGNAHVEAIITESARVIERRRTHD